MSPAHYTLYTIVDTAQYTDMKVHSIHTTLLTAHYTYMKLHTTHLTAHETLHIIHTPLHTAHSKSSTISIKRPAQSSPSAALFRN